MSEYTSSEELQRRNREIFIAGEAKKDAEERQTERQKLVKVIDRYIARHQTTKAIRERLKDNGQTVTGRNLEVQFAVSDAIVTELEKIKSELR